MFPPAEVHAQIAAIMARGSAISIRMRARKNCSQTYFQCKNRRFIKGIGLGDLNIFLNIVMQCVQVKFLEGDYRLPVTSIE